MNCRTIKPAAFLSSIVLTIAIATSGCARMNSHNSEAAEAGETKVRLDQTPPAVRQAIEHELAGATLEDIALKNQGDRKVYETDIIRDGQKWEVLVGEDGQIIHNVREGSREEKKVEKATQASSMKWRDQFNVNKAALSASGNNSHCPVEPGRVLKLAHGNDRLTVSILPGTKTVDGVKVAVLEEREEKDGQLIEISHNYLATDPATGDVYYFGEDVDNYKDGKIINHDSAWLAGEKGARFGLFMPGKPKKGDRFYQEIAPKVALDRIEIVSADETVKTPAGTFQHCVHFRETTPLESDVSHKYYAPGIGMIKDDEFELTQKP